MGKIKIAYWTILYKKNNEPHEFFTAKKCTKSQAFIKFEKAIPSEDRGRVLHIREEGTFNFHTYPDQQTHIDALQISPSR